MPFPCWFILGLLLLTIAAFTRDIQPLFRKLVIGLWLVIGLFFMVYNLL